MTQFNITLNSELIKDLFSPTEKDQAVKTLLENILNQVLQAQATDQIQAQPYERNENRLAYRNGNRDRQIKSRVGTLTLSVPRLRNGEFSTDLFARYQRNEQALVLAMMEMVIQGVSTRKVSAITEELCGTSFSKSTISSLCTALDPIVKAFLERPLESHYPFIIVDALYTRVREDGAVRSVGLLLATGVTEEGYREILGMETCGKESEDSWGQFFQQLKSRGLHDVKLVVSDAHAGLIQAIRQNFIGASWQRCQTHFSRNILDKCPKSLQPELKQRLRALYETENMEDARELLKGILTTFETKAPRAIQVLEEGFEDALQILQLPLPLRKRLRTSNSIERLNQEIRRRERVIRIFPNRESLKRLIGALLMDLHEGWQSGKRYLCSISIQEYLEGLSLKGDSSSTSQVDAA